MKKAACWDLLFLFARIFSHIEYDLHSKTALLYMPVITTTTTNVDLMNTLYCIVWIAMGVICHLFSGMVYTVSIIIK